MRTRRKRGRHAQGSRRLPQFGISHHYRLVRGLGVCLKPAGPGEVLPMFFVRHSRESGNPAWIPARAALGRNDEGPCWPSA